MKFSTVLILCLDVLAQQDSIDGGISGTPFYSCQTADSIFTLESLTLDPYPIPIGATLVSTSRGVLKQPIKQGARLNVLGKLGFLTVAKEEYDFCELTALQGNPCPIPAGPFSFNSSRPIPSNIPPATITLRIESKNADGKQIDCQEGKVRVFQKV